MEKDVNRIKEFSINLRYFRIFSVLASFEASSDFFILWKLNFDHIPNDLLCLLSTEHLRRLRRNNFLQFIRLTIPPIWFHPISQLISNKSRWLSVLLSFSHEASQFSQLVLTLMLPNWSRFQPYNSPFWPHKSRPSWEKKKKNLLRICKQEV